MFQSKAKLIVAVLTFVVLIISSLACGPATEIASGFEKADAVAEPLIKPWNKDNGQVTFILTGTPSVQVAVFANGELAAFLSVGEAREFPLSALEDYMISIRTRSGDGAWESRQTLPTIKAGDMIVITANGLNISVK